MFSIFIVPVKPILLGTFNPNKIYAEIKVKKKSK